MHIASKWRLFLLLGCTLLLTACAAPPARQSEMTATERIFPAKPPNKLLYRAVFIEDTNPWSIDHPLAQVQSSTFHKAVAESLHRQGWLADSPESAFWLLNASLNNSSNPYGILIPETTTNIRYVLTEKVTGQVLMQEDIQGVGTVTPRDLSLWYSMEAFTISVERSFRDNIFKLMERLDVITRQAYDKDVLCRFMSRTDGHDGCAGE